MPKSSFNRLSAMIVLTIALFAGATSTPANAQGYEFRLVQASAKQGQEAVLAVRRFRSDWEQRHFAGGYNASA